MTNTPMTSREAFALYCVEKESKGYWVVIEDDFIAGYEASQAQQEAVIAELVEALDEAILGLSNGLWDYGPSQDEHEQCDILLEKLRAISDKVKGK